MDIGRRGIRTKWEGYHRPLNICRFCDIPGKIISLKIAFLIARSTP